MPSMPRLPKPPGTMMPDISPRISPTFSGVMVSESIQWISTWASFATPGVAQRLCDAEVGVVRFVYLPTRAMSTRRFGCIQRSHICRHCARSGSRCGRPRSLSTTSARCSVLHHQGDLIENAGVEVLQHMVRADIAEQGELVADVLRQGVVGAAHEHVRPQADALQLADAPCVGFVFIIARRP